MRIYLLRHGETTLNQSKCYYGRLDVSLNEQGVEQAGQLANYFAGYPFDYVVSSPLKRAYDTAKIVLNKNDMEIVTDERLMEQNFGIFEGHTYQQLTLAYPKEMNDWNKDFSNYRIPQGESFSDVRKRVDDFVKGLPSGKGTMLLTAHKGTLGHLLASMLNLPLEGYWNFVFEQGCFSCIDVEDGYAIIRKLNQSTD